MMFVEQSLPMQGMKGLIRGARLARHHFLLQHRSPPAKNGLVNALVMIIGRQSGSEWAYDDAESGCDFRFWDRGLNILILN